MNKGAFCLGCWGNLEASELGRSLDLGENEMGILGTGSEVSGSRVLA